MITIRTWFCYFLHKKQYVTTDRNFCFFLFIFYILVHAWIHFMYVRLILLLHEVEKKRQEKLRFRFFLLHSYFPNCFTNELINQIAKEDNLNKNSVSLSVSISFFISHINGHWKIPKIVKLFTPTTQNFKVQIFNHRLFAGIM